MPTASIVFCDQCGSERVDVASYRGSALREFTIRCYACNHESTIKGFALGRAETPETALKEARSGCAGKGTTKMPAVKI